MNSVSQIVILLLASPVWAALECTDWEGKSIQDGSDFNPKKEDACYVCRCDNGQSTMCKTVSCAAPTNCLYRAIPGRCCDFECVKSDLGDTVMNGRENYTSSPPSGPDSKGTIDDGTMTDLGLRLAASTVTTFLILALLLFLLHRLRQRRMLMALRRYNRRRHDFDDSDNISYSPDFYGLQCPPPYEDPPPPYSPPKPRHIHSGDCPPPYEAIADNGNSNQVDGNGNQTVNRNGNQTGVTGSLGNHRNTNMAERNGGSFNFSAGQDLIDPRNLTGMYSERGDCNFSTNITNVITSDSIQSQPYSFVQSRNVSRCVTRNDNHQNGQRTNVPSNVSDIGESTSSTDSINSRNSTPVPTELEDKGTLLGSANQGRQTNGDKLESEAVTLSEDAETTVRQFLDQQFGNRNRNFPASMSQSWTCPEQTSAAPHLGLAGSFNRNSGYFQQNASQVSRSPKRNESEISQNNLPKMGIRCGKCNNIIACKCNKVKTNGLLTRSQSDYTQNATNSTPKEKLLISRNRNLRLLPGSFGVRVSYVEPEDTLSAPLSANSDDHNSSSQYHSDSETNISYFTPNTETVSPCVSQCEGSETQNNSRRQELLRELRLSHLLFSPPSSFDSSPSPNSPSQATRSLVPKTEVIQSQNSAVSVCPETGQKKIMKPSAGVIGNDAQYPDTSYNFVKSPFCPRTSERERDKHINERSNAQRCRLDFSGNTLQSMDRMTTESEEDNSRQYSESHIKNLSKQSSLKPKNIDYNHASNDSVPNVSHLNFCFQNEFNPNVNVENSAMKVVNDKDVSKFINSGFSCNGAENAGVPSVSERANASQFYNCEHEDKVVKKSKRKILHKRHSAGSLPGEKSTPSRRLDLGQKHSPKQKSATLKSKHLRHLDVSDNDQSNSDNASNFIPGRQYYRTVDNHHHSPVKIGISSPISSAVPAGKSKSKSSPRKTQPFLELHDDNLVLTQKDVFRPSHNNNSSLMSSVHNPCSPAVFGAKSLTRNSCHSDSRSHSLHGKKNHKRSRSLGKEECYVGVHMGNKHAEKQPSHKSSARKKKNRQSFPGTNAFHRELEHVLESQKQAMSFTMSKAMGRYSGEHGMHAVTTQV